MRKLLRDRGLTLAAAWTFNQLAYAIVYPFIPLYLCNERQLPIQTVGLIFPLMGLATILAPPVAGILTDRFGRNFMMNSGQVARGVVFLVLSLMTALDAPFWLFALMLMVNTAVGVAFQVGADAYLADFTTEAERPRYYGKIRIGFNIGWAIGPMLGAFFAKTPFWLFFLLTALLCFGGGVFTRVACPPLPAAHHPKEGGSSGGGSFREILSRPKFLLLLFGSFLLFCLSSQLYSTLSIYATNTVKISREALGSIYSLNGFAVVALQIPLTILLERLRVPLHRRLLLGSLLYALGYISLGGCIGAWTVAAAVLVLTCGEMVTQPALYTSVSGETRPENAGRFLAAFSMMRGIGYAVGPWIGAQLYAGIASPLLLWASLSLFAVFAAAVFSIPHGRQKCGRVSIHTKS